MALATGLRVVERAEAIGESLGFVELGLVGGVGGGVDEAVALVVEAGGASESCVARESRARDTNTERASKVFMGTSGGQADGECTHSLKKSQVKKRRIFAISGRGENGEIPTTCRHYQTNTRHGTQAAAGVSYFHEQGKREILDNWIKREKALKVR
jgi:hypothetical protein